MEKENISSKKYILTYGVILGIISIIYGIILYLTNNSTNRNWIFALISSVILCSTIIYGIYLYRLANDGFLTLKSALKTGIGIALIGGIIAIIWEVFLMNIIDPNMIDLILNMKQEKLINSNPSMSQEEIEQSMITIKKFNSSYILSIFSLINYLFLGFLISLIGGAIMQRKRDIY